MNRARARFFVAAVANTTSVVVVIVVALIHLWPGKFIQFNLKNEDK